MGWDHGYYSKARYTANYYREMAPNWIDFAVLIKGHAPPREREGVPFHYLDLGCGMGFGLCLLAAAYPEGSFVGVDFLPDHIAHAQQLASELKLTNICFIEADLLALQDNLSVLGEGFNTPSRFHYVAAHGVATWVSAPIQAALLAVTSAVLVPGGIFYCSYNTYPGWQPMANFYELVRLEMERCDSVDPSTPTQRARATLEALIKHEGSPSILGQSLPTLKNSLSRLDTQDPTYLNQEYANAGWQPLYVAEMHRRCRDQKLTPISTATLPELFPVFIPAGYQALIQAEENPTVRETLIDLLCFKAFRRDLMVKGKVQLTSQEHHFRLSSLHFRLQEPTPIEGYRFMTSFGEIVGDELVYKAAEAALATSTLSFADWCEACGQQPQGLVLLASLLLHSNRVGLDRGEAGKQAQSATNAVNNRIRDFIILGRPYGKLVAPLIGTGVDFNIFDSLLSKGIEQGFKGDELAHHVLREMELRGIGLTDDQQLPITDLAEKTTQLSKAGKEIESVRLPFLRGLGVLRKTHTFNSSNRNKRK